MKVYFLLVSNIGEGDVKSKLISAIWLEKAVTGQCQVLSRFMWPIFHAVQCLQGQCIFLGISPRRPKQRKSKKIEQYDTSQPLPTLTAQM